LRPRPFCRGLLCGAWEMLLAFWYGVQSFRLPAGQTEGAEGDPQHNAKGLPQRNREPAPSSEGAGCPQGRLRVPKETPSTTQKGCRGKNRGPAPSSEGAGCPQGRLRVPKETPSTTQKGCRSLRQPFRLYTAPDREPFVTRDRTASLRRCSSSTYRCPDSWGNRSGRAAERRTQHRCHRRWCRWYWNGTGRRSSGWGWEWG